MFANFKFYFFSKFMRSECSSHKFAHGDDLPVNRLMIKVGNRMQLCTQRYDKRPYGVGLLVAGYDVSIYLIKYSFCPIQFLVNY